MSSQLILSIKEAMVRFNEKPIFGWGADGFRYFNKIDFTYSHSNYLELFWNKINNQRIIPIDEFILGSRKTKLEQGEILTSIITTM